MFLRDVALEHLRRLVCRRFLVPSSASVGEIARDEDEVVGCRHYLFGHVWDLPSVVKVNVHINLINDRIERLIDVMRRIHPLSIDLEFRRDDLVLVFLGVIDHLQACVVPVANVLFSSGILHRYLSRFPGDAASGPFPCSGGSCRAPSTG